MQPLPCHTYAHCSAAVIHMLRRTPYARTAAVVRTCDGRHTITLKTQKENQVHTTTMQRRRKDTIFREKRVSLH